jgi:hypothetical protein
MSALALAASPTRTVLRDADELMPRGNSFMASSLWLSNLKVSRLLDEEPHGRLELAEGLGRKIMWLK